jgi:hypothetical protein
MSCIFPLSPSPNLMLNACDWNSILCHVQGLPQEDADCSSNPETLHPSAMEALPAASAALPETRDSQTVQRVPKQESLDYAELDRMLSAIGTREAVLGSKVGVLISLVNCTVHCAQPLCLHTILCARGRTSGVAQSDPSNCPSICANFSILLQQPCPRS